MIMSTGTSIISLPLSFLTRTAMPLSRAPVSVIMPRKPPRIMTNRQTGSASAKPRTGAVKKSLRRAAVTAPPDVPETTTVITATIANRSRRMVNDEGMPRFFLAVSVIVLIPPSLLLRLIPIDGANPCRAKPRQTRRLPKEPLGARSDAPRADRQRALT